MSKAINRVIKVLVYSDLVLNGAWGLLAPVFAIFVLQNITIGNIAEAAKVAGFTTLIYFVVKSPLQIPIGKYLDKNHGEKDDLWAMIIGGIIASSAPFIFIFSSQPWHIYAAQALHAIGMALVIPSWSAIFTRHIDKGEEAFEWSVRSSTLGMGIGVAGAVGGIIASKFGFNIVFFMAGVLTILSSFLLILINKDVAPKHKVLPKISRARTIF